MCGINARDENKRKRGKEEEEEERNLVGPCVWKTCERGKDEGRAERASLGEPP